MAGPPNACSLEATVTLTRKRKFLEGHGLTDASEPIEIASNVAVTMAFACENFTTDPMGRISFNNIIDALTAATFPASTQSFFTVFGLSRKTPGFLLQCKVEVLPPTGTPLVAQVLQDLSFTSDKPGNRVVSGFPGITWPSPGEFTVKFTSRNNAIASFPIRVLQAQLPIVGLPGSG